MKKLILTIAMLLAGCAISAGVMVDNRRNECRADLVKGKPALAAAVILNMTDAMVVKGVEVGMVQRNVLPLARPIMRPVFEANAYCAVAERAAK